jgi:integrase
MTARMRSAGTGNKSPEARGAEPTYGAAALAYMQGGGEERPQTKSLDHFRDTPLSQIDQAAIDAAAIALFPDRDPATPNREVYTPVSAVLKHAGVRFELSRPKGSRGKVVTEWLWPEQAFRILEAAIGVDLEFGLLLAFLCYTGCRLSEALRIQRDEIRLEENFAYLRHTKNGEARAVHLPLHLVEVLKKYPRKLDRASARVFRFHKSGNLYFLFESACMIACGLGRLNGSKQARSPHGRNTISIG